MRRTIAASALLLAAALTGCAESADEGKPVDSAQPTAQSPQATPAEPEPRTAAEFLARAEEAMAGQKGWSFAVKGREGLVLQGQENAATYTAALHRTTGEEWALHSTGTTLRKGVSKPEEIYVVDGTVYVKKDTAGWEHGPLTDAEFADKVEDPLAALDAFRGYGDEVTVTAPEDGPDGQVELRVRKTTTPLTGVRDKSVVQKALRELDPTLRQLHAAGVAAPESEIAVSGGAAHPVRTGGDRADHGALPRDHSPAGRRQLIELPPPSRRLRHAHLRCRHRKALRGRPAARRSPRTLRSPPRAPQRGPSPSPERGCRSAETLQGVSVTLSSGS
ncbi:hypothetical protein SSP24_56440 [Streptomyces spinoverrucosus]|uniref:Lipoprotein n=1 Tax=Streptomyces spinoverrucosus TaxID=284043 RepID=A0A4Y3VQM9_9ACTN|nr:hypothetical protein [Streptomyces spinoverrucosus]GEC07989.1 hypothetical protein SSP24_56440 [Streptomyces spinoverrucosus]GHB89319.1 hypothetical protein GCM10010397_71760 [Streptomyces spinoverrucosus]